MPGDWTALPYAELTSFSQDALDILRDPKQFKWYTVALLSFVFYVYGAEVEKRNISAILAGLALWSMDWINEVVNGVVLHATNTSAIWTTTSPTSFEIFVGLNIEIAFMFAVTGVIFTKYLPSDPRMRILGIPNRWVMILGWSVMCVFVEVLLTLTDTFHWHYSWWNFPNIWLIIIFGYGTFFAVAAWVYDMRSRRKQIAVVATLASVDVVLILVFGVILGWI